MASTPMSTITEEFLTCPICFEVYTDPKTLPCLHSFCKSCIDAFTKNKPNETKHSCPTCREPFELSNNDVENLKTSFSLINLIELASSSKEVKKSFCGLNGEKIKASSQCLTCKDLLCSECAEHRHRSTKLTLNHEIDSLSELPSGKYNEEIHSNQQIPCTKHTGEDLRYFCKTCDVPICRDCLVLCHKKHKYVAPLDAKKRMEEKLNLHMNSMRENLEKNTTAEKNVSSASAKLVKKKEELKADLEKKMNIIIENMMESKMAVENEFEEFVKSKEEALQKQGESIEKERKLLEETYSFCNNLLRCGNDIEILTKKSEMNDRLSALQSLKRAESCNLKDIDLPVVETSSNGHIFRLVYQKKKATKKERTKEDGAKAKNGTTPAKKNDRTNGRLYDQGFYNDLRDHYHYDDYRAIRGDPYYRKGERDYPPPSYHDSRHYPDPGPHDAYPVLPTKQRY